MEIVQLHITPTHALSHPLVIFFLTSFFQLQTGEGSFLLEIYMFLYFEASQ